MKWPGLATCLRCEMTCARRFMKAFQLRTGGCGILHFVFISSDKSVVFFMTKDFDFFFNHISVKRSLLLIVDSVLEPFIYKTRWSLGTREKSNSHFCLHCISRLCAGPVPENESELVPYTSKGASGCPVSQSFAFTRAFICLSVGCRPPPPQKKT